jgi:hypothetical protein
MANQLLNHGYSFYGVSRPPGGAAGAPSVSPGSQAGNAALGQLMGQYGQMANGPGPSAVGAQLTVGTDAALAASMAHAASARNNRGGLAAAAQTAGQLTQQNANNAVQTAARTQQTGLAGLASTAGTLNQQTQQAGEFNASNELNANEFNANLTNSQWQYANNANLTQHEQLNNVLAQTSMANMGAQNKLMNNAINGYVKLRDRS